MTSMNRPGRNDFAIGDRVAYTTGCNHRVIGRILGDWCPPHNECTFFNVEIESVTGPVAEMIETGEIWKFYNDGEGNWRDYPGDIIEKPAKI